MSNDVDVDVTLDDVQIEVTMAGPQGVQGIQGPQRADIYSAPAASPPATPQEGDLWWVEDDAGGGPIAPEDVTGLLNGAKISESLMRPFNNRGVISNSTVYNPWDTLIYQSKRILITAQVTSGSTGFISSSNYSVLQNIYSVDVRDFGAAMNGTTDDTAVIQAAINSFGTQGASQPGTGGIVRLPPGTTRTSATLDLPSNVHLMGSGF